MTRSSESERVPSPSPPLVIEWCGDEHGTLRLLDQTRLPNEVTCVKCESVEAVFEAIRSLRVRGAPAIGVAAAYGVVLGTKHAVAKPVSEFLVCVKSAVDRLAESRPTAVNLFWALQRQQRLAERLASECGSSADAASRIIQELLAEARRIEAEDREMCSAIGRHGAELLCDGDTVLTHCNAGSLATAGDGTALAVIYSAVTSGKRVRVFADETRPLLQGARLTAWELQQRGVPVTLICDSMAATVMRQRKIQAVIVGADRIAANGDTANKIGTYSVALLAKAHGIPFYVAAPTSTFDWSISSGEQIPIEERASEEITHGFGHSTAPVGVEVFNPAFDVTPAELITAIITERGVVREVNETNLRNLLGATS